MNGFNLSDWAIRHRSLVWFFMIIIVVAGVFSYLRLGRNEDPAFTIKTMVVQAAWPGATIDDTLRQITDRIEKKLQETPYLDYIRSYTAAGQTTILVNLQGATPRARLPMSGTKFVRRSATFAAASRRESSARSSTTSSATPTGSSMPSPPTASPIANCATTWREYVPGSWMCRTSPGSTFSVCRTSASILNFRSASSRGSALTGGC
jgi:hypothetical protein